MFKIFFVGLAAGALAGWLMGSAKGGILRSAGKEVMR